MGGTLVASVSGVVWIAVASFFSTVTSGPAPVGAPWHGAEGRG